MTITMLKSIRDIKGGDIEYFCRHQMGRKQACLSVMSHSTKSWIVILKYIVLELLI